MKERRGRNGGRGRLTTMIGVGGVCLLLLVTAALALAQGSGGEEPPRDVDRPAPLRAAQVLERTELENGAVQTVVALAPLADTYIASDQPAQNFGSGALFVGYNNTYGAERSLLYFDVDAAVPAGATINSALLQLNLSYANPPDDAAMTMIARDLLTPWNELTVTWNTEPTWGDVWATSDVGTTMGWYEWEIGDLVTTWVDGTRANNGIEVEGDEDPARAAERAFSARETTTDNYPRLVIDYTDGGDTTPPDVVVAPLPAFSPRTFAVSWSDQSGAGDVATYDVEFQVDDGAWQPWLSGVTITSSEFTGSDGHSYAFRARGVDANGNVEPFGAAEAVTTVDETPPVTTVDPLPAVGNEASFSVSWSGDDGDGSGIVFYDVRYRVDGGAWTPWQQQTVATNASFTTMVDGYFEFEARAYDAVGNIEPFHNSAEAAILVDARPPFIVPQSRLPYVAPAATP